MTKATRVVTFFNGSHYWGGQLQLEAEKNNVTRTLKQNCKSRWYALILQAMSVRDHRYSGSLNYIPSDIVKLIISYGLRQPLSIICIQPDAVRKTDGLSPVAPDVISIVIRDEEFWLGVEQLIKTMKPVVDTIGDCETREASLALCMLELIRCARKMSQLALDPSDNTSFWMHAKHVFNHRFHEMNTNHHSLALFLHPLCRKLAISQAANGRSFEFMATTALSIARQWKWSKADAKSLIYNLKEYHKCVGIFAGGQTNALDWWECLLVTITQCPLKAMAIILHSVVPHAAMSKDTFLALVVHSP